MWPEFKRTLNECGLIWNLSEWMTTIVYHGTEWNLIKDKGTDLDTYFPQGEKRVAGDGNISKTSALGAKLVGLLDRPKNLGELKATVLFCCLSTVEFEEVTCSSKALELDRAVTAWQSPISGPISLSG